jgi:hypothetical protein
VLAALKTEAERLGIPYQTYIGSVLHRFAQGELIDRKTIDLLKQLKVSWPGRIAGFVIDTPCIVANDQMSWFRGSRSFWYDAGMRDIIILVIHLIVTVVRLARPGGLPSVVAESTLVRDQLLIFNRGRKRARNLRTVDRVIAGLCALFMRPARVLRSAIVLKPSTLLHFITC